MQDTRQCVWWNVAPIPSRPDRWILTPFRDLFYGCLSMHSQYAEDTIVNRVLGRIGPKHRNCIECGAGDGMTISNTLYFRRIGWSAWMIEADAEEFSRLQQWRLGNDRISQARVTRHNVDGVLDDMECPEEIEFLSLDIDGDDLPVFRAMRRRPRIVCIEHAYLQTSAPEPAKEGDPQAGFEAVCGALVEMEYMPLAATPCNVIAVRGDAWTL